MVSKVAVTPDASCFDLLVVGVNSGIARNLERSSGQNRVVIQVHPVNLGIKRNINIPIFLDRACSREPLAF